MGKCLIFLTKKYPFETGEEFIENEIPVIAKEFEKVIIISTSVSDSSRMTRAVPKNAEVAQYHAATAFEALFGYLYLSGNMERLRSLFNLICGEN